MPPLTTSDFDYVLPTELIAKYPLPERSQSRLLVLDRVSQRQSHHQFINIIQQINSKDLVVFNDTKVIPARLFGYKASSGGKLECLVERILSEHRVLAHLRFSKAPQVGSELIFADHIVVRVLARHEALFELEFCHEDTVTTLLQQYGEIPLPVYMERAAEALDIERYQTIFAERLGAVAAPTASLHFDAEILTQLQQKGVTTGKVTLHVGAGTFQPVRVEELSAHVMHKEYVEVSELLCEQVKHCKAQGGRVFAIGTTVVRCLETAALQGEIKPYQGDTQLFIHPGYSFRCVDALLTNFHFPKTTLLMLVCAFGGYELVMQAYANAIEQRYRLFSYGDAMLIV